MTQRSEALAIVDPYRAPPAKREKVGPVEVSNCRVCSHRRGELFFVRLYAECWDASVDGTGACRISNLPRERRELIKDGICPGYQPSPWTRLLRLVGLRKPVMR